MRAVNFSWAMNKVALKRCNIVVFYYLRKEPDMQLLQPGFCDDILCKNVLLDFILRGYIPK